MQEKKRVGAGFGVMLMSSQGKILLGKRNDDAQKADSALKGEGTWTMPGGKLEFHESFEDGAKREVMEETSLQLNSVKVICVNNDMVDTAHFVTIGLFSQDFSGEVKVMEPDEITEWRWFSLSSLPENIFPPSKKVLQNYHEGVFYKPQLNHQ
ncbi:ADP-ribose pyrophosphatase [Candidatus Woesearchaeota archaeon CG_4_10_14_0_2_um_filter_33_13]|nr:MAG: ADP-ribose pyrophosphatase [Candidatus Woesearchaeota archaeon CG_4_10_14_0_2_um_filter_33_13]